MSSLHVADSTFFNKSSSAALRTPPPAGNDNVRPLDADGRFAALHAFYKQQLALDPTTASSGAFNYDSPSTLTRIMNLYARPLSRRQQPRPQLQREAQELSEGFVVFDPESETKALTNLRERGWHGTTSMDQQRQQMQPDYCRFTTELRPIATLLRTKRTKRCRTCRSILVKPEPKVQSTRYRIRLLASSYPSSESQSSDHQHHYPCGRNDNAAAIRQEYSMGPHTNKPTLRTC